MKRIISIFATMGLALLLVSCEKEKIPTTINEVTDLYTVPADAVQMPSLSQAESVWSLDRRYFNLAFGSALSTTLVGYDAILAPGQYVLGADQIGNAVLNKTKVNGQQPREGYITVNRDAKGAYNISATVDGNAYYWSGTMPFNADPDAVMLPVLQQAQSNVANGTNSVTLQLATEGIAQEFDWTTWQTTWKGEGGYLALDLFSDDGYLHEGTFVPCAEGGVINAGEFGIGYDTTMQWGEQVYEMKDWGTCWWTVKDGAATATKITGGIVTVTKLEGDKAWRIAWGEKFPVEYVFEGDIPTLTKPKKPEGGTSFDYTYTDEITASDGVDVHAIKIADKNGEEMAYLELLTANGETDLSGSYPSTSYAGSPGQMRDGYSFPDWGIAGGSYYVKDGEKQYIGAGTATLVVTKLATGAYKFACEFFDYSAAGPDYVPEGGGEGGDDVSGDVVLSISSGLTYTMEDVTASNTDANQSPLSGVTLWRVTVSDGSGTVAAFDLGTKEGSSDLAGSYTVMSYPDAPGKAGNGWGFPSWGMVGGSYFVVDGAYYYIPSEATINVSNNADGTLKIKFEGAIQNEDYSDGGKGGLLLNNIAKS